MKRQFDLVIRKVVRVEVEVKNEEDEVTSDMLLNGKVLSSSESIEDAVGDTAAQPPEAKGKDLKKLLEDVIEYAVGMYDLPKFDDFGEETPYGFTEEEFVQFYAKYEDAIWNAVAFLRHHVTKLVENIVEEG